MGSVARRYDSGLRGGVSLVLKNLARDGCRPRRLGVTVGVEEVGTVSSTGLLGGLNLGSGKIDGKGMVDAAEGFEEDEPLSSLEVLGVDCASGMTWSSVRLIGKAGGIFEIWETLAGSDRARMGFSKAGNSFASSGLGVNVSLTESDFDEEKDGNLSEPWFLSTSMGMTWGTGMVSW